MNIPEKPKNIADNLKSASKYLKNYIFAQIGFSKYLNFPLNLEVDKFILVKEIYLYIGLSHKQINPLESVFVSTTIIMIYSVSTSYLLCSQFAVDKIIQDTVTLPINNFYCILRTAITLIYLVIGSKFW